MNDIQIWHQTGATPIKNVGLDSESGFLYYLTALLSPLS